jgi:hypothetical protein
VSDKDREAAVADLVRVLLDAAQARPRDKEVDVRDGLGGLTRPGPVEGERCSFIRPGGHCHAPEYGIGDLLGVEPSLQACQAGGEGRPLVR